MTSLVATLALLAGAQAAPTPAQLISDVFAKYHAAQKISGQIVLTQSIGQQSGALVTTLQLERPGKLYIRQVRQTANPVQWLVTCDGNTFSYDEPLPAELRKQRLVENLRVWDAKAKKFNPLTLKDAYAAAVKSLGDRSAPLDIAIARVEDLRAMRLQWSKLKYEGLVDRGDQKAHLVTGDWHEYGDAPATGTFRMVISEGRELLQYAVAEPVSVSGVVQTVVSTWNVNLKLDGEVDQSLFKVIL